MVAAGLVALAAYLLSRFRAVLPPLILAIILAYVLAPTVGFLQRRLKIPRWLATLMVYSQMVAVLVLLPALLIPPVVERLQLLAAALEQILASLETYMGEAVVIGGVTIDGAQIIEQAVVTLRNILEPVFGRTLGFAFEVLGSAVMGIFVLVISFYLVKDSAKLRAWLRTLPPASYRADFRRLWHEINAIWGGFFRGQLLLALVVGTGFTLVGSLIGLPFALAMGVLAGLMEFLPSIGHTIWMIVAGLLAIFEGSTWLPIPNWAMLVLVFGLHSLFAQFDLNFLMPRIVGRRIRLHPLVIILGIIAGASVAGALGVFLAAPTIATSRVLGRYVFANLFDEDPFPPPAVDQHEPSAAA